VLLGEVKVSKRPARVLAEEWSAMFVGAVTQPFEKYGLGFQTMG